MTDTVGGNENYTSLPETADVLQQKQDAVKLPTKAQKAGFGASVAAFLTSLGILGHAATGHQTQDFPKDTYDASKTTVQAAGAEVEDAMRPTMNSIKYGSPEGPIKQQEVKHGGIGSPYTNNIQQEKVK